MKKTGNIANPGSKEFDKVEKAIDVLRETLVLNEIDVQSSASAMLCLTIEIYREAGIPKQLFLRACEEAWDIYEEV